MMKDFILENFSFVSVLNVVVVWMDVQSKFLKEIDKNIYSTSFTLFFVVIALGRRVYCLCLCFISKEVACFEKV